jgi:hypothetical protein
LGASLFTIVVFGAILRPNGNEHHLLVGGFNPSEKY